MTQNADSDRGPRPADSRRSRLPRGVPCQRTGRLPAGPASSHGPIRACQACAGPSRRAAAAGLGWRRPSRLQPEAPAPGLWRQPETRLLVQDHYWYVVPVPLARPGPGPGLVVGLGLWRPRSRRRHHANDHDGRWAQASNSSHGSCHSTAAQVTTSNGISLTGT